MNATEARARRAVEKYLGLRPEFSSRLKNGGTAYAAMHRAALKSVKCWEWFTTPAANLNPGHFILEQDNKYQRFNPGRRLRVPSAGAVRQGFDASGAVRVIECDKNAREFWHHADDRIDATTFAGKQPVLIQTLWLKNRRPVAHVFYNRYVMTIRLYEYEGERLTKVIMSSGLHRKERHLNINEVMPSDARKFGMWVRADSAASGVSHRLEPTPNQKPVCPIPTLNLRQYVKVIENFILKAIGRFTQKQKAAGPRSRPGDVSCLGLGYCHYVNGCSPWVLVHFDTREDFEDDGTWTHEEFATLKLPEWEKFWQAYDQADQNGVLIDMRGRKSNSPDSVSTFGQMFAEVLSRASERSAFKALKKSKSCKLLVHDIDHAFGWKKICGK